MGAAGGIHHAFADNADHKSMTDLGTLAGGLELGGALGVNDAGVAVGDSETTDGGAGLTTHAFIDDLATSTMTDIGTLAGGTTSSAAAHQRPRLGGGNEHGDRWRQPSVHL